MGASDQIVCLRHLLGSGTCEEQPCGATLALSYTFFRGLSESILEGCEGEFHSEGYGTRERDGGPCVAAAAVAPPSGWIMLVV